jgi:hypothetical protein
MSVSGGRQRRVRKRPIGERRRPHRTPSILIVECDSATLRSQAISMAADLERIVRTVVPSATIRLVSATSQESLLSGLGRCKEECGGFDNVAIVGHSNRRGLRLAPGLSVPWDKLGLWIEPFRPKRAILVACEAGGWLPSEALFNGIRTLREIYGSPVVTTEKQAASVTVLVPYLMLDNRLPRDILAVHLVNFALTGGVIFRHTRKQFQKAGPVEAAVWTGWEEILKAVLRR